MPSEIVIVRHGQCTGNVADRASFKGDHSLFTEEMRSQKSSLWPLTSYGIRESELVGDWIRNAIAPSFDYYFVSDYVRAVETSVHMGFKGANWIKTPLLRERDWGGSERLPYPERNRLFHQMGINPTEDSLLWHPPGGETLLTVLERLKLFLGETVLLAPSKRILLVSHGAPLQALRVLQCNVEPSSYAAFIGGDGYIRNCHVFHYFGKKDSSYNVPIYSFERSAYFDSKKNMWIEMVQKI